MNWQHVSVFFWLLVVELLLEMNHLFATTTAPKVRGEDTIGPEGMVMSGKSCFWGRSRLFHVFSPIVWVLNPFFGIICIPFVVLAFVMENFRENSHKNTIDFDLGFDETFYLHCTRIIWVICAMVKSRYIGDGHPTFNRNLYNGYINPYGIGLMSLSPIIWK